MMTGVMERTLLAPRPAPPAPRTPDRATLPYRRIVYGVLVGALTMLAVATLDTFAGATVPVLGTIAALPGPAGPAAVVEVPAPPSQPGTCLNWSRPDAADAAVVDCGQTHLFEQAGSVRITDQPALPDDQQWRQLVKERCDPIVTGYLKGKLDPDGRYRIGALKPSAAKWSEGDRELRCGLQRSSQSGALFPMSGKVAESDQSDVQQPGTCLAIDGRGVGDPTDCGRAHAVETVGVVDLGAEVGRRVPRGRRPGFLPAARLREGRGRLRGRRQGDHGQEADRLLGQRDRGLLEGGLAEGQLQPGRAAARPERVRAGHRVGQGCGFGGQPARSACAGQLDAGGARLADRHPEQRSCADLRPVVGVARAVRARREGDGDAHAAARAAAGAGAVPSGVLPDTSGY